MCVRSYIELQNITCTYVYDYVVVCVVMLSISVCSVSMFQVDNTSVHKIDLQITPLHNGMFGHLLIT